MKDNNENIIYETVKVNKKRRLIITIAVIITLILSALSVIITLTYTSTKDKGSTDNVSTPLPSSTIGNTFNSETPKATDAPTNSPQTNSTPRPSYGGLKEKYLKKKENERENFDFVVDYIKKAGTITEERWTVFLTTTPLIELTYGYNDIMKTETLGIAIMEIDNLSDFLWAHRIEFARDEESALFHTVMIDKNTDETYEIYSMIENKSLYNGGLGTTLYADSSNYDYLIQTHTVELIKELFDNVDKSFSMHGLDVTMSELGFSSYDY